MNQPQLFDHPVSEGERMKVEGQVRAALHSVGFMQAMRTEAERLAKIHGTISTDDLRAYAHAWGIKPNHPNAWGAIFAGGKWVCVGRVASRWPDNHAREIRVWALKGM